MDYWNYWILLAAILTHHKCHGQTNVTGPQSPQSVTTNSALMFNNGTNPATTPSVDITTEPAVQGNNTTPQVPSNATTPVVENITATTGQPNPESSGSEYVLRGFDSAKTPCCKAIFNASISVKYYNNQKQLQQHFSNISNTIVSGHCGINVTDLTLLWKGNGTDNNSHTLTFVFAKKAADESDPDAVRTWISREVALDIKTSLLKSPNTNEQKIQLLTSKGETHFQTPLGRSYVCDEHLQIDLHDFSVAGQVAPNYNDINTDVIEEAVLDIWGIKAQPFLENGEFGESVPCGADVLGAVKDSRNIVPIVILSVIVAIIVIMVVTYYVIKRRSKQAYQPM